METKQGEFVEGQLTSFIASRADRSEGRLGRNHANHVTEMWKTTEAGRAAEEERRNSYKRLFHLRRRQEWHAARAEEYRVEAEKLIAQDEKARTWSC